MLIVMKRLCKEKEGKRDLVKCCCDLEELAEYFFSALKVNKLKISLVEKLSSF